MTNPLKVYVAGTSVERDARAKPMMRALREHSIVITHDWNRDMDAYEKLDSDAKVPEEACKLYSELDANGVRQADFVILLAPDERGCGVWIEFGLAVAWRIPVIVCGSGHRRSIFMSMAYRIFETDEEGLEHLLQIQKSRA